MSSKKYRQRGFNVLWPWEIETWRLGEPVPEWLSDNAEVKWISGTGDVTIGIIETNTGGYEIKAAGIGQEILVRVPKKSFYVYHSSSTPTPSMFSAVSTLPPPNLRPSISSISPELLDLLYIEIKE